MQKNKLQELINIIERDVDIKEFISNFVNLEKKGNNYIGLCPFHVDSNPSMVVSSSKGIYKCFSCGAGGNIIKFVQMHEGLTFIETLKFISEKSNINWSEYIDTFEIKVDPEEDKIKKINLEAMKFFKFNLTMELKNNDSKVKKYIEYRKFNSDVIEKFNIGFSGEKNSLFTFLLNKGFSEEEILRSGLIRNYDGKLNTYFNNRIIFPIQNENQEVLGFSGRTFLENDKNAKYLNSVENKVFKKRDISYNLNNSKKEILKNDSAIILEGFMDVIALDKLDVKNTVASMGIEFNFESIKKLTNNFILAFDNDEAGLNANLRIGKKLLLNKINPKVLVLKKYKDFDELINNDLDNIDIKKFILENQIDFIDFLISNLLLEFKNKSIQETKLKEVIKYVSLVDDNLLKQKYRNDLQRQIKENFNIEISDLFSIKNTEYKNNNQINIKNNNSQNNTNLSERVNSTNNLQSYIKKSLIEKEKEILLYALDNVWFLKLLINDRKKGTFSFYLEMNRLIFDKIILLYENYFREDDAKIDIIKLKLNDEFTSNDRDHLDKISRINQRQEDKENLHYFYKELLKKHKINYLELEKEILEKKINNPNIDKATIDDLFKKIEENRIKLKEAKLND